MLKLNFNCINKLFYIFCFFFLLIGFNSIGQSVIELADPYDADVILLSVSNKEDADIIVYKTNKISESKQWDCMWMFKKWGFADLSLFIYTDLKDTLKFVDEDSKYRINGKIYFTQNINERGYKNSNTTIEGLIRKYREKDSLNVIKLNNDSLLSLKNDSLTTINPKIENVDIKVPNNIVSVDNGNIVFKVQVGACRREIPEKELHKRYPGNSQVSVEMHDGWYKYLIGNFNKYSQAKQEKISSGTPDAWVVVYKNEKRVHISEVINFLSYYPLGYILISIIS